MSSLRVTTHRDQQGEVVLGVFGLPRPISDYGPRASAVLRRGLDRAVRSVAAEIDLDELAAAEGRDREETSAG